MAKVSVLIPARNERFLVPTVNDVLGKATGDVEVVAVLEDWLKENTTPTDHDWARTQEQYGNRLHTIYHHEAKGMRPSINEAAASAMSRGAKYLMKLDAHCALTEGWDEVLKADCDSDWVVIPRRGRLDPENWVATDTHKPDIDYHYLSFPDNPNDFGGPGLNGKVWEQRARERKDILLDDELSSQGSCWFTHAEYFTYLELMDEASFGPFWCEAQEVLMKAWLAGGRCVVNKKAKYLHLHKGRVYGRGYRMPESWLKQGASFAKNWIWNDANFNHKQTRSFEWLIDHFWPIPTWKDDWREVLYKDRKPRGIVGTFTTPKSENYLRLNPISGLRIHAATYGIGAGLGPQADLDVTDHLQSLVKDNALDIVVNNSTICPGQNPHRGKRKKLTVAYAYNDGEPVTVERVEKDWLIIGQVQVRDPVIVEAGNADEIQQWKQGKQVQTEVVVSASPLIAGTAQQLYPMSPTALNDYLIRKFQIPAQRLRGPMPIEVPSFHRNDLAQLFAELGFNRGAEIGVAEGKFSEVICKANPELRLLCVDPWHSYKGNPQSKTKEKDEFAYREAQRRLAPYPNVKLDMRLSMDAVRDVEDGSLDFVNIDGHHGFRYAMLDLLCWSMKVRTGGIILLDDYIYLDRKRWGAGVVEAVQAFTSANEINPWFICNADRSIDAFFVKGDWK